MESSGFEQIDMIEVVDQLDAYDLVTSDLMSIQLSNLISMQSSLSKLKSTIIQCLDINDYELRH